MFFEFRVLGGVECERGVIGGGFGCFLIRVDLFLFYLYISFSKDFGWRKGFVVLKKVKFIDLILFGF